MYNIVYIGFGQASNKIPRDRSILAWLAMSLGALILALPIQGDIVGPQLVWRALVSSVTVPRLRPPFQSLEELYCISSQST